jgi:AraC-like DNA-binding protein/quercetin dioxygenase-like cupin family protein
MVTAALLQEDPLLPETARGSVWPFATYERLPEHFHGQLEYVLVLRGWMDERVGTRTYRVHAGQLLWHLPGLPHQNVTVSSDFAFRVVHVGAELAPPVHELAQLVAGYPVVELKRRDFDAVFEQLAEPSSVNGVLVDRARELRAATELAFRATIEDRDDQRATSLVHLASCLILDDPSLKRPALCKALDVSPAYLSRRFRAELGTSLQEQRTRVRLARFATLVASGPHNWRAAARASGFGSYSQLHRDFCAATGMTPRAYFSGGREIIATYRCPR